MLVDFIIQQNMCHLQKGCNRTGKSISFRTEKEWIKKHGTVIESQIKLHRSKSNVEKVGRKNKYITHRKRVGIKRYHRIFQPFTFHEVVRGYWHPTASVINTYIFYLLHKNSHTRAQWVHLCGHRKRNRNRNRIRESFSVAVFKTRETFEKLLLLLPCYRR